MPQPDSDDDLTPSESSHLLSPALTSPSRRGARRRKLKAPSDNDSGDDADIDSIHSKDEPPPWATLGTAGDGYNLPFNNYTTIDWLRGLAADSVRHRRLRSFPRFGGRRSIRSTVVAAWDSSQGWVAAVAIGAITAAIAYIVDVSVATVADWKEGYCSRELWLNREQCCYGRLHCADWRLWASSFGGAYTIYVALALTYGLLAGGVTLLTRRNLPAVSAEENKSEQESMHPETAIGKQMYMAAGSGIPEIKTILSGFAIPDLLNFNVLVVKAVGAVFAVSTGMCLGKEGPYVHISTCVGYLVSRWFPKYWSNERKLREMLSVACSSGLSVAFGAPLGGVLFSYEEISTFFPRRVLWKSFVCSLVAAAILKQLNPAGTGRLVFFETKFSGAYLPVHYLLFVAIGIAGGIFGGIFCRANFRWSKLFRKHQIVKDHPVLEISMVVLITALLQYPNRLLRDTGDIMIMQLITVCEKESTDWVCVQESQGDRSAYYAWLISGIAVKLLLMIITFGCKIPSGIIIPAMDAGALFGRLLGLFVPGMPPGAFAMVGAAAFLGGVCRMTVSLTVIMIELTGAVDYVLPLMVAIITAKWVADAVIEEGIYDLSQALLGHPFLDTESALAKVRAMGYQSGTGTVADLVPAPKTMEEITMPTGPYYRVSRQTLRRKLAQLRARELMDAGLVLVNNGGVCHGYLPEAELEWALEVADEEDGIGGATNDDDEIDLMSGFFGRSVDRCPIILPSNAPLEYAVEMFGKLGLRYMIIVEEETAKVIGVVIKKRLLNYLDSLH